ncbi:MAG: glutamine-hydrolyzing carbamoyl-phosphate synthase small subunit [Candidatus Omnitrophica bacterium]|nr:glutamine-hydrolyzing carbamoyl-phosphate synthase small subunit [Candidatus Omnitrophota bacterium]MDD5081211.1 glutamine-hydrolyzing carbamoyl-phosphate synthase small subunit [Candidatus Omnitrophota bacterium]MDD5440978.1 glutamine-hydrolyzing carbamoyl-phosphate synthase small subunit [Candidatus Omnitrophota bacterium]
MAKYNTRKKAKLLLEDGKFFEGYSFGADGELCGEAVFNTAMSGYQEIITDPSYLGQFVTMTYPLIGNYGITKEDMESRKPFVNGFIVKECSRIASNWRAVISLPEYLEKNNILGIEGIDTRQLTKHIRVQGSMKAVLSTIDMDNDSLLKKVNAWEGILNRDLAKEVTVDKPFEWNKDGRFKVVVIDCGVKNNILRLLAKYGCRNIVVPAGTTADEILKYAPDGVMISNGPGDPSALSYVVETTKKLMGKLPIFGICLGHQIIGLALGGKTYKLKFGHHGGNQPVKELKTGHIAITSQNHCFCVDIKTLKEDDIEITHINLNDNTVEGMRHKTMPIFSVQYHPESSPGPHDAECLFKDFTAMMENGNAQTH